MSPLFCDKLREVMPEVRQDWERGMTKWQMKKEEDEQ
jgi:hypothetical protein